MSDNTIKLLTFILWPILMPIILVFVALAMALAWFVIPFTRVVRNDKSITLKLK